MTNVREVIICLVFRNLDMNILMDLLHLRMSREIPDELGLRKEKNQQCEHSSLLN
jgi:hypothetical protein